MQDFSDVEQAVRTMMSVTANTLEESQRRSISAPRMPPVVTATQNQASGFARPEAGASVPV